jgi:hypothetical protein
MQACDVFVSFKNLDSSGQLTRDASLARSVFDHLASKGLRVFYSNVSLELLGVAAYQQAIDAALDAARVLIAVGTSSDHMASQWVRYEWSSFYNDILSGIKRDAKLFVYVEGVSISELPRMLRQNQVFVHQANSLQCLCNFVCNALGVQPVDPDRPVPHSAPPGHVAWLESCELCGQQYDPKYPTVCCHHPLKPESLKSLGARDDYKEVWRFPCCGLHVVAGFEPKRVPGCQTGDHRSA